MYMHMYILRPGTLTAVKGELFCGMCRDQSGLWMQAVNSKGIIGYLPANYLELFIGYLPANYLELYSDVSACC